MAAFPNQFKKLRPLEGEAGGIKARSAPEKIRMAVYLPIAEMFKLLHPICECCSLIFQRGIGKRNWTESVHHTRGREGLLLFATQYYKGACLECHSWIDANRDEARKLGLLAQTGEWNHLPDS